MKMIKVNLRDQPAAIRQFSVALDGLKRMLSDPQAHFPRLEEGPYLVLNDDFEMLFEHKGHTGSISACISSCIGGTADGDIRIGITLKSRPKFTARDTVRTVYDRDAVLVWGSGELWVEVVRYDKGEEPESPAGRFRHIGRTVPIVR